MRGKISSFYNSALNQTNFPKDFINEHTHMPIGQSCEQNANESTLIRYERARLSLEQNLTIKNPNTKTKMVLLYPSEDYNCSASLHTVPKKAVMLFGSKCDDGHAIAVCSDCLLKLALVLLKYYKSEKFYIYNRNQCIRLTGCKDREECYVCRNDHGRMFKLCFHKHHLIFCEKCLIGFIHLILTAPTTEALYPKLANEYIKLRKKQLNKNQKKKAVYMDE